MTLQQQQAPQEPVSWLLNAIFHSKEAGAFGEMASLRAWAERVQDEAGTSYCVGK